MIDTPKANARYLNFLFLALAIIFPLFITARTVLQLPQSLFFGTTALVFILVLLGTYFNPYIQIKGVVYLILVYVICFAFVNIKFAMDPADARNKWIIWIVSLFVLMRLTVCIDYENLHKFMERIPWILFIGTTISVLLTIDDFGKATSRNNSIGLYAGAAFVAAFYKKGNTRLLLLFFSAIYIYGSSSRAALLGTGIAVIPLILYSMRLRRFYLYLLPIFILLIYFAPEIEQVTGEFFQRKALAGNALEALLDSQGQREYLFEVGALLVAQRPYLGYGLGDGYIELVILGDGEKTVHNGYLTTFIEVGIPFAMTIFISMIVSFFNLVRDRFLNKDYKVVTLCFFGYILIRAYSENYLIFNSANNVSLIFFALLLTFLFRPKQVQSTEEDE